MLTIQKLKPRTVHLYSKADWASMKREIIDFQSHFLATCSGKNTETLWQKFKAAVDTPLLVSIYLTNYLRGKTNLSCVTQEIKRMMNRRDRFYQVQKRTGNETDRSHFKQAKYEVDCKLKTAYNNYLDSLVGTSDDEENGTRPDSKKLFSYLKNCRQNSQGTAPLSQDRQLHTDNFQKANEPHHDKTNKMTVRPAKTRISLDIRPV